MTLDPQGGLLKQAGPHKDPSWNESEEARPLLGVFAQLILGNTWS